MASKDKQDAGPGGANGSRQGLYEALVKDYYSDIFRYAFWLCKSRPLAEDLVQETYLRAWRSLHSLQKEEAAKAWLFTILRREHARLFEKYRPDTDDIDDYALADLPDEEPDRHMERTLLYKAMDRLTAEYREPLMLQVIGGFRGEEIGRMLGLNNNTVMTRLFRARNMLKQELNPDPRPERSQAEAGPDERS